MVVAYVDSVMSRLGRHLSIQAALAHGGGRWCESRCTVPTAAGLGLTSWAPVLRPPAFLVHSGWKEPAGKMLWAAHLGRERRDRGPRPDLGKREEGQKPPPGPCAFEHLGPEGRGSPGHMGHGRHCWAGRWRAGTLTPARVLSSRGAHGTKDISDYLPQVSVWGHVIITLVNDQGHHEEGASHPGSPSRASSPSTDRVDHRL